MTDSPDRADTLDFGFFAVVVRERTQRRSASRRHCVARPVTYIGTAIDPIGSRTMRLRPRDGAKFIR